MPFMRDIIQMPRHFATLALSELKRPLSQHPELGPLNLTIGQASASIQPRWRLALAGVLSKQLQPTPII